MFVSPNTAVLHDFAGNAADDASPHDAPVVCAEGLKRYFAIKGSKTTGFWGKRSYLKAVDGVSFTVNPGETLGIVGESGCGKSTLARLVLNMLKPSAGEIRFNGQDLTKLNRSQWRKIRRHMQLVFQDPLGALDPRIPMIKQVMEPLTIHGIGAKSERSERAAGLLEEVGIKSRLFDRTPYKLSGGQRQRVVIARALASELKLIVCDEPVSALDVSIQAQVVNLLDDLKNRLGLTMMFISHDLSVIRLISDRVAVMYLGRIVEEADCDSLFENPLHPYTQALISAVPIPEPGLERKRIFLTGDPPNPIDPPGGCRFHTRCPRAEDICKTEEPPMIPWKTDAHRAACRFVSSD